MANDQVKRLKLLWAIPVFQAVYPKPFGNFLGVALNAASRLGETVEICPWPIERDGHHKAMNRAAQVCIRNQFDAMLVSDDDCFPPYDAIYRLVEHFKAGRDIVMGLGFMRNFPHTTTVGRYYPEGTRLRFNEDGTPELVGFEWIEDLDAEPSRLITCDFAGMPIGIVSRKALEAMEAPWYGTAFNGGECTADVYFGHKAQKAGLKVLVDRDISCGHLADGYVVTEQNRSLVRGVAAQWKEAVKLEMPDEPVSA